MPPILDCPDLIVEPKPFHSLGPNDDMFVRQTYDNKQQLIFALSLKATREKFQFKTKHSNKNRYEVYCEIENCSWRLYAKRLDPTDEFEIRTFNNVHTCSSLQIHPNHKHANKKVMGTILHEIMGKTRSKVWRPNEISRDLNALLEINVDYKQAWRAKQYAMELLLGSSEECFAKLPIYFHNRKRHNPGTVAYIQTDSEDCFECCFYAIGSTTRAFKRFCRKVIIMDGAHLKGAFKGTILHAVAMDGNNQILPLVHGICKKESGLTWTWFLEKLYECLGDCQELTFVTDRADAIRVSIENVFPYAHHGLCAFHILGNIVHKFGKIYKTKVLFWRLVKAYKRNVFEELWYRFSSTRPQVAA
ncbi:protein FAR1-RELATED SEQUENCE 8-like [Lactuca sativa]|uniref:protein FAR1-RELATED SEQUENCE 8-like n=1 Tax=Lactuca sativa TaxID=4236 RepID=UPI0022B04BC9|nr:protein FAR1-RELATED SEQUENCE 8-like [Lactuca sativa]